MSSLLAPAASALRPADVHLMVYDLGTCMGRVAPAHVEGRSGGIVRLRVAGRDALLLGEDEIEERQRLAIRAREWDARERARGGGR